MDIITYALLKKQIEKLAGSGTGEYDDTEIQAKLEEIQSNIATIEESLSMLKTQLNDISFGTDDIGRLTYEKQEEVVE